MFSISAGGHTMNCFVSHCCYQASQGFMYWLVCRQCEIVIILFNVVSYFWILMSAYYNQKCILIVFHIYIYIFVVQLIFFLDEIPLESFEVY